MNSPGVIATGLLLRMLLVLSFVAMSRKSLKRVSRAEAWSLVGMALFFMGLCDLSALANHGLSPWLREIGMTGLFIASLTMTGLVVRKVVGERDGAVLHANRRERRRRLLREQWPTIRDHEVREVWHIASQIVGHADLRTEHEIQNALEILETKGHLQLHEEGSIDVDFEGGHPDRMVVSFTGESISCPRSELIFELKRFAARLGEGEP